MAYGLIAGALVLFGSSAFMHFTYSKSSNKKERYFLCAVVLNLLVQMFLIYEYMYLRGGFVVHNCVYAVSFALLLGAIVLWTSRMLFSFAHEGFRVLLGASAVVAGCLGGCGIDMIIAFEAGAACLSSYSAACVLCIGAVSVMLSDIVVMLKNFSVKDRKIYRILFDITSAAGFVMIFYGGIIA
ncbi:MAG: hypothetical protein MR440_05665 [Firmicutes bacterium]|nr:hypothetical protein [Bacillota bacterium]